MSTLDTRLALMRSAERLFAERGLDAVSLREVSAAARQKNTSAAQYHFESKEGLVDAILERHSKPIHERWAAMLDLLQAEERVTLRSLVEVFVMPIAAKLDDDDGGRHYLELASQLAVSPTMPLVTRPMASTETVLRLSADMMRFVDVPPDLLPLRMARVASTLYLSLVEYARLQEAGAAPVPQAVLVSDLIDGLYALISAPTSRRTQRLLTPVGEDA